jgi:putative SOS response-associated peptidase YedK
MSGQVSGLVPRWWSKPLKELRAATFNARAETVETKPFFRDKLRRWLQYFREQAGQQS